jgi:hypothetical protein
MRSRYFEKVQTQGAGLKRSAALAVITFLLTLRGDLTGR